MLKLPLPVTSRDPALNACRLPCLSACLGWTLPAPPHPRPLMLLTCALCIVVPYTVADAWVVVCGLLLGGPCASTPWVGAMAPFNRPLEHLPIGLEHRPTEL